MKKVVHAACPHDCPDACGVLITVENGRATKIQGDPDIRSPADFSAPKWRSIWIACIRRIACSIPCASTRRKGSDEALTCDGVRTHLLGRSPRRDCRDVSAKSAAEFGSEAILPYSYGGTLGALNGGSMDRRFFHRLGASQLERTICSAAGEAGLKSVLGVKLGTEPEQFRHSRYIIAWASNIHGNNVHLWPFIEEARRNGAKLVVIDPYRTRTAACADWYLPINPGTDAALALGMMHVIISENLYDADYVSRYTLGFEQLREKVQEYPPETRRAMDGHCCRSTFVKLAREYATTTSRSDSRELRRAALAKAAAWRRAPSPCCPASPDRGRKLAAGCRCPPAARSDSTRAALKRTDLMEKALGRPARTVNMVELGKALNTLNDPPVKALFVYNSNPAAVCPNHNEVIRGLEASRPVHRRPRAVFHRHDRLCRHRLARHDFLRAQRSADGVWPLLPADVGSGDRTAGGMPVQRGGLSARWPSAWGLRTSASATSVDHMIDQALWTSANPWLEGIDPRTLERETARDGCQFGSTRTPRSSRIPFCPSRTEIRNAERQGELYSERSKRRA